MLLKKRNVAGMEKSFFWYSVWSVLELTVTSACSLVTNSESGSGWPVPRLESVWGCLWHMWGDGDWEGGSDWEWQYGVMVVVKRPKVKGGLCSAVRVAAWAPFLLSLYLGQIFVSLLEQSTNVDGSDLLVKYNSTETGKNSTVTGHTPSCPLVSCRLTPCSSCCSSLTVWFNPAVIFSFLSISSCKRQSKRFTSHKCHTY